MPVAPSTSGFIAPCIPTRAVKPPAGLVHEIKHDGYRLQVRSEGGTARLFTRRGYGWSGRYPAIAVTGPGRSPKLLRGSNAGREGLQRTTCWDPRPI
jgi:hypothetical protein